MANILIQTAPADGHVFPILPIVQRLAEQGHSLVWIGGRKYQRQIEKLGARFIPIPEYFDPVEQNMYDFRPELAKLQGIKQIKYYIKHEFSDLVPYIVDIATKLYPSFKPDLYLGDPVTYAMCFLAEQRGKPSVMLHVIPLPFLSQDTAPFGMGLLPGKNWITKIRNRWLNALVKHIVMKDVMLYFDKVRLSMNLPSFNTPAKDYFVNEFLALPEKLLYATVPSLEYPMRDAPPNLQYIGPIIPQPVPAFEPPDWWDELKQDRPVILINQGTVANDPSDLILPALEGLKDTDALLIAVPLREAIPDLPARVIAAGFIPFANLLPFVDVMVTNGGYGGTHMALAHGVPLVISGNTDDKMEVSARVAYAGAGINLRAKSPSPTRIKQAVQQILRDDSFARRAEEIKHEIYRYDPILMATEAIEDALEQRITKKINV